MPKSTKPEVPPAEWLSVPLHEAATINAGRAPRYAVNGEIKVIGANGQIGWTSTSNASGGIAVGRVGASGVVRRIADQVWLSDNVLHVMPRGSLSDDKFLYHVLANAHLPRLATKTAQPLLTQTDLGALVLRLPPMSEQHAIAAILDAIDEAIVESERAVDATEVLRQSLLHELLTRGLPGWHTKWRGVPGIGTVPACWPVTTLGELCAPPEYGASAPAMPFDSSLPRYVRITDIDDDGRLVDEDPRSADPKLVRGLDLREGDLLFARSGTVGRTYLHSEARGPCVFAGYLIRFQVSRPNVRPDFVFAWTRTEAYRRWVERIVHTGAQPNINAAEYSALPVPLPPEEEQDQIMSAANASEARRDAAIRAIAALQRVKRATSGALLTGGLRVLDPTRE